MKRLSLVLLAALLVFAPRARAQPATTPPATTTTTPEPAAPSGQMQQGFVLETHVTAQLVSFSGGLGGTLTAPLVTGGIFGGYKINRFIFGLGFDFTSYDAGGGGQIVMRWVPGVRVAIVRSSDERVELFGQFDFSVGHDFGSPQKNEIIGADLGPGVRYWVHRQFAFSAVSGWNGTWSLYEMPGTKVVFQGVFAGIQVLGVF